VQTLLTVIVTWLSLNFGLPAHHEHPRVEFAIPAKMAQLRASRLAEGRPDLVSDGAQHGAPPGFDDVHAIYDDRGRAIYLPVGWTGASPAEVSVLVHEMVHHLQNVAGLEYDCAEAREKPAYQAQARWLELFGGSLAEEFQLDGMTILVRTSCMH